MMIRKTAFFYETVDAAFFFLSFFFKQDPHPWYALLLSWQHAPNWVPNQCHRLCLVNESPPSLISIEGENSGEGTCSPASVPFFSHVNGGAVLDPGHHLPFLRVWAPGTPDVSHCMCVSKQKVVSTHSSCGPKRLLHKEHEPALH